jgi:hypothetical protein
LSSRIRKACARSSEQFEAEWPPIQTGVKSQKRVVTENADFESHEKDHLLLQANTICLLLCRIAMAAVIHHPAWFH